jgi:uncharacterized protein
MQQTTSASRWALVTGASAGIGAAFARELASRNVNLILTARRTDRLQALAEELKTRYPIKTEIVACDLARIAAPGELCAEIAKRGLNVDVLINNAGYGVPGSFLTPAWQEHVDFIQVLMTAPAHLCYLLLPGMRQRGYGRIVNIASLAGHIPGSAGHTLYAASKAFMIKFSQSLALENRSRGINVCALCPGFTYSEFHDVTGSRKLMSNMPKWLWMNADEVARQGVDAVERGEIVYVNGRVNRLIKALVKLMPDRLALNIMQKRSKSFRVTEKQT